MTSSVHVRSLAWAGCVAVAMLTPGPHSPRESALRLPRIFGDGMVLQRNTPLRVWGWAAPGSRVSVTLGQRTARTDAKADSTWMVTLPAVAAGGPYTMSVAAGSAHVDVKDILIGDVWVASGQSNMEWPLSAAANGAAEIAAAHDPQLRQFAVPHSWSESPERDVVGGSWAAADPEHVGAFTAVGYFFARELRKSVGVPIGLIHTSWGGSNIETWMSRRAHGFSDSAWSAILRQEHERAQARRDTLRARFGMLPSVDSGLAGGRGVWADAALDDASWRTIAVPALWETAGYEGMDGIAWYRTTFNLTDDEARQSLRLGLGTIDDDDISWVNGVEVGRTNGYNRSRVYDVPPSAVRAGRNVIAVRVADGGGGGGIYGDPALLYLEIGGARRPLGGTWRLKIGAVAFEPDGQQINKVPTILYNRMIHPLLPFPIKGVIWYQGESNANSVEQAAAYRQLFAQLIQSWRREWSAGRSDFPFLWVQLPNFMQADSDPPTQSAWATLRESQAAAQRLPHTGQAVTIDVGEAGDIHPRNKQDPGRRLALVARGVAYGQSVISSGPTYRRHTIRGDSVVVEFDHVGGGLVSRAPGGAVTGFAIAGADRRFVWAQARIDGARVILRSGRVPHPVAVRYAWSNNPGDASLTNREALPAAPFRTDAW